MRLLPFLAIIAGLFALLARILSQDIVGVLLSSIGTIASVILFLPANSSSGRVYAYATALLVVILVYLGTGGVQYNNNQVCADQTLCYGIIKDDGCIGIMHTSHFSESVDCAPISVRIPAGFSFCAKMDNVSALTVIVFNDGGVPLSSDLFSSVDVDGINISSSLFGKVSSSRNTMNILDMYNCGSSCAQGKHNVTMVAKNYKKISTVIDCK
ncbi:MAG: hypothetical protein V1836_01465 [Candidatus Aenigmatarchaeota archaeon]